MERARVVINTKEGIIEFEGPLDFVSGNLKKYGAAIKGLMGTAAAAPAVERAGRKAGARKRGRPAREVEVKPATCIEALRQGVSDGFFAEPHTIGEVRNYLAGKGLSFTMRAVRAGLTRLVNAAQLETSGRGRGLRYRVHS